MKSLKRVVLCIMFKYIILQYWACSFVVVTFENFALPTFIEYYLWYEMWYLTYKLTLYFKFD